MAETLVFGKTQTAAASNVRKLTAQTIDGTVAVKDPVHWDSISSSWKKSSLVTLPPQGMVESVSAGVGDVVILGALTASGFTAGKFYFLGSTGGITTTPTAVLIGQAKTATDFFVHISQKKTQIQTTLGFWKMGGSTVINKMIFAGEIVSALASTMDAGSRDGMGSSRNDGYKTIPSSSNIGKLGFLSEVTSTLTAVLPSTPNNGSSFYQSDVNQALYAANATNMNLGGGLAIAKLSTVTDAASTIAALTVKNEIGTGSFTSLVKGFSASSALQTSVIGSLLYSNDTTALLVTTLSSTLADPGPQADDSRSNNKAGYIMQDAGAGVASANVDKFTFATDLITNLGAIRIVPSFHSACSKSPSNAYVTGDGLTALTGVNMTTDAAFAVSSVLSVAGSINTGTNN